jgi:hypothetical protein
LKSCSPSPSHASIFPFIIKGFHCLIILAPNPANGYPIFNFLLESMSEKKPSSGIEHIFAL